MAYLQYALRTDDARLTCWLLKPSDALKVGARLTLKGEPERIWTVEAIYGPMMLQPPDKTWRVGGL